LKKKGHIFQRERLILPKTGYRGQKERHPVYSEAKFWLAAPKLLSMNGRLDSRHWSAEGHTKRAGLPKKKKIRAAYQNSPRLKNKDCRFFCT